jgi:hypothetical protein
VRPGDLDRHCAPERTPRGRGWRERPAPTAGPKAEAGEKRRPRRRAAPPLIQ